MRTDNQTDKTFKVSVKSQSDPDFKITKITPSKSYIEVSYLNGKSGEYTIVASLKNYHEIGRFSGNLS